MGARIILLEESEPLRKSIDFMLSGKGYTVVPVPSFEEALALKDDGTVDLFIADLHSYVETGIMLLEPFTDGSTGSSIPVIILHNDLTGAYTITRSIAGTVRFITKPFSRDVLLSAVYSFLNVSDLSKKYSEL